MPGKLKKSSREPPQVRLHPIDDLRPYANNARTHSGKQIGQIASSIEQFGFTNPVLVDRDGGIVAGHGRVEAARQLGWKEVPTIRLDHLTDAQKRAYIIADNRLAQKAGWDDKLLALELQYLTKLDLDFDVTITGFETVHIDLLIDKLAGPDEEKADEIPPPETGRAAVSRLGDLWQLGPHRVFCGSALDEAAYRRLLDGDRAQLVFTDPPYNVRIDGHVGGLGRVKHRPFVMATGEMSAGEFSTFLGAALRLTAGSCADGAINFVCMDWRHIGELLAAALPVYGEFKNLSVWSKSNAGMGSFYRSKHELVFVFKVGTGKHINNFELGQHGRYRTNVWDYPGINSLKRDRETELAMHPTVKPVALVADAIKDCSRRKGIVLDPFAGSGTTIIAAHREGRVARAIELDPIYVDVIARRWEQFTGETARHAESGLSLVELSQARAESASPPAERKRSTRRESRHAR